MLQIISTTDVQKKIGQINADIGKDHFYATKNGQAHIVMLPYFKGCEELVEDYMDEYYIFLNRDEIIKELKESADSGLSDLVM